MPLARLRRPLVAVLTTAAAVTAVLAIPTAAEAAVRASNGARCTIIGTTGADVLVGTRKRDVICGLGGNDVIKGRGGDDVLEGGPGRDRIEGGPGKDRLNGGTGNDVVDGGADSDQLIGGSGKDSLLGRAGADQIGGGPGDDQLTGGAGGDEVDGGSGFNLCDSPRDAGDEQIRCAIDTEKPVVRSVTVSAPVVDVSKAARVITVRARITDDTGVRRVQMHNAATRVSGTARDGIWQTWVRVPRYVVPGMRGLDLSITDRVGRRTSESRADLYRVINTVVDRQPPVLTGLALNATAVNVRTSGKTLSATATITDDLAGADGVYLCLSQPNTLDGVTTYGQAVGCEDLAQTSGRATKSVWKGSITVPKGAPSGRWNAQIWIEDASGNFANEVWFGPDQFALLSDVELTEPRYKAIPGGAGRFTVTGSTPDTHSPVLTSLTFSSATIDTSRGAVKVTATIAGTDVEGITGALLAIGGRPGYPGPSNGIDWVDLATVTGFTRISGTDTNGVWRATFVVPGGTPDGRYSIQASLDDRARMTSWFSPGSEWDAGGPVLTDALAPTGTYFRVANTR